jgi:hypothetical protein
MTSEEMQVRPRTIVPIAAAPPAFSAIPGLAWQRDRAANRGAEVADFQGLGNAAEWSRTITPR